MLGFFCDWCGKAYREYPVNEYGTTLGGVLLSKATDEKPIPIGTKVIGEAWSTLEGRGEHGQRIFQICPECYAAYMEFVKKRKEKKQ